MCVCVGGVSSLPDTAPVRKCRVRKETGSQVIGSWNKEARANSSFYRVREALWQLQVTV